MSAPEPEIKRWTAKRKTQLVLEILKGKTTVAEAARRYDLKPSEIETWVQDGIEGMENSFRARPRDIREQYERKLTEAHAALGEAQLEIKALKKLQSLLDLDERSYRGGAGRISS
ncbi:transposase [Thermosulfuriphilus ammonigenes]|uniref:Transposase n=1 Tax=Thermosulfuriphilus ammonigenes TaxID=1936021 RepID=A0A6G7PYK4_9BACT|nr:transposase [Thermosulfuriphilus ammonigenes]MBA2849854.1 transposase-like protein [Thermosulfuriphilus ammonigenes]QIJ72601.1 transposase [Thermosulfuriphilus ammonigenes]